MSTYSVVIGTDSSLDMSADFAPESNEVTAECCNGQVYIAGPFEGWMGYQVLTDFDSHAEGVALVNRIAANPVVELEALGYDHSDWFVAK